jgi:hypothetical protein
MATFTKGDTAPALTGTVNANLTGASIAAHIRKPDLTVVTKAATATAPLTGAWSVTWTTGDLNQVGGWDVEVQVTFADTTIQTFGPTAFYVQDQIA